MDLVDLDALFAEADALEERGEYRRAFRVFLRGARAGGADCAGRLASLYSAGIGVRRSIGESIRWHHFARRRGCSLSTYNLAVTYASTGRWKLARAWWERALREGERSAQIDVALCLLGARGDHGDPSRARRLLSSTARLRPPRGISQFEHEEAMALLGVLHARGIGGRRSPSRARHWLVRASADNDYPEAARALTNLDTVVPLDVVRSAPWR